MLGSAFYLQAFFELENDRNFIVGATVHARPIPWSALNAYALRYNLTGEAFDDLLYFVGALDAAYLKYIEKKN